MKKQKRILLKHGSAMVNEDCPKDTVDILNKMSELAYNMPSKQSDKVDIVLLVEEILKPIHMNDVFTWAQIEKAIKKALT